jgi:hypothetical protein
MANPETAAAIVGMLNKVIKYAVGLGATTSILSTSLYTGKDWKPGVWLYCMSRPKAVETVGSGQCLRTFL